MKIRGKFIIPVLSLVIVATVIAVITVNLTVKDLVQEQEKAFLDYADRIFSEQAKERKQAIYNSMEQQARTALEQASFFTRHPQVQEAYRLALTGNIDDERDETVQWARQQLRSVTAPMLEGYKEQTGAEVFNLHFHLPNARSFARLWRDGWNANRNGERVDISDDLSSFRQTVVAINQGDHKPLTGIEIGRGGFALRGLAPVTGARGEHLGSCEVLASFNDVLTANHVDDSYQIAVYMLSEHLPTAVSLQNAQRHPVLENKYVLASSTNREITDALISSSALDAGRNTEHQQVIGSYYVSTFPIKDFSGELAGVIALAYDMNEINDLTDSMERQNAATLTAINWRFGGGGLILIVTLTGIVVYITRLIVNPLRQAVAAAQQVAAGDLSHTMEHQSRDEVGELAQAVNTMIASLNVKAQEAKQIAEGNLQLQIAVASDQDTMGKAFEAMVERLNEVLGEIQSAASQIDSGSEQVSDTAQQLSQGATESAASLEEISSSMQEIESQAQQSANNANQASQLTKNTQTAAQTGSERMNEMIAAMDEINAAGQSINKIIKVIDEIAFQTNLLALNAAVEAARAGQHGKGFAVVAEEVRNLAARSAKAARETAELIESSVAKSVNGTQIAQRTSESLEEIVTSVLKVNDLVSEIAAAGTEQAQGISQVNIGLNQIDQAVQQSTATAEESASAAEELSGQAAQMRNMLMRFTLKSTQSSLDHQVKKSSAAVFARKGKTSEATANEQKREMIALDDDDFGKF